MATSIKDQNRLRKVYSFYRAQPVPLNLNITNNLSGGGVSQNQLVGVWIDAWPAGSQMTTTGSIAIKAGAIQYASQAGSDIWFYVSGSGVQDRSVFATTTVFSASVIASNLTGSLTKTAAGLSYLVGGTNIAITSQSNGQVIVSATTSVSGTGTNNPWIDGNNKLKASSSVSIDRDNHFATDYGTDVFFFVSGSQTSYGTAPSTADRKVVVLPDTVVSGTMAVGAPNGGKTWMGNWVASPAYGAITLGPNAPSSQNFSLLGAGGDTIVNCNAGGYIVQIQNGNSPIASFGTTTSSPAGIVMGSDTLRTSIGQQTQGAASDVTLFVSGSTGLNSGANRHVVVLPDVFMSGSILSIGQGSRATTGSIRADNKFALMGRNSNNSQDLNLLSLDGASNLSIGDASFGGSTIMYGPSQIILLSNGNMAIEAGADIFMDGLTTTFRSAAHVNAAIMTITGNTGVRWNGGSQPAVGTDVFFFVSGSQSSATGTNRKVSVFGGDVVVSGSLSFMSGVNSLVPASTGSIRGDETFNIWAKKPGSSTDTLIAGYQAGQKRYGDNTDVTFLESGGGLLYFGLNSSITTWYNYVGQMVWFPSGYGQMIWGPTGFDMPNKTGGNPIHFTQYQAAAGEAGSSMTFAAQPAGVGANLKGGDLILSSGIGSGGTVTSGSIVFLNGGQQAASFRSGSLHLDDAKTGSYPTTGLIRTPYYASTTMLWSGLNSVSASNKIINQVANTLTFGDADAANGWFTNIDGYTIGIDGRTGIANYVTAGSLWTIKDYVGSVISLQLTPAVAQGSAALQYGFQVTGSLSQVQSTSGKGATLTITPQQGASIGQNLVQDGGTLALQGGSPTGTSFRGSVRLQLLSGSTADNLVEVANVVTGSRVLALVTTSSLTNVNMPSNTGDLVMFISNAATLPTTSSAGGGILYNNAGALTWYSPGGTQTVLAPNDPHCPKCGRDWVATARNNSQGWKKAHCFFCLEDALAKIGISPDVFSFDPDWNNK